MTDWYETAAGASCHWCDDRDTEPADDIQAEKILCRGHIAEYFDRMEAAQRANMIDLGIIPR